MGKKVCISFMTAPCELRGHEYNILILDLDSGVRSRIQIDRDCIFQPGFCVLGSTLYAFEGYHELDNPHGKSIFKYKLPSSESFDLKLDKSMFIKVGSLNDPKRIPVSSTLANDKILVFSLVIQTKSECDQTYAHDLEIFDPVEGACHLLPILCEFPTDPFVINSHALMNNSLVLHTEFGTYSIDLEKKCLTDPSFPRISSLPSYPGHSFAIIENMLLVPYYAYDLCGDAFYEFPHLSSLSDDYTCIFGGMTTLEDDSDQNQIGLCFLKVGLRKDTRRLLMMLDVYKLDINELKSELPKVRAKKMEDSGEFKIISLPGATKMTSHEFAVDVYSLWFLRANFSSILG